MTFDFGFGGFFRNGNVSAAKPRRQRGRSLRMEQLEEKEMLSVTPWSTFDDQVSPTALIAPTVEDVVAVAAVASINPVVSSGKLLIEGTNNADWIEIQETSTQIIVHSFDATGMSLLNQWSFTKSAIAMIEFNGYDGNDTFKNSYNGVTCSIACRLDGGTGNNTLIGGTGNDWIYGGTGNNILDGGAGDNMVIGGYGNNTFYNSGNGSTAFAWVGSTTNNRWAAGNSLGNNDALLLFSSADRNNVSNHTFGGIPYTTRSWTNTEITSALNAVMEGYNVMGTYSFFRDPYASDGTTYLTIFDYNSAIWMAGMNSYMPNGRGISIVFNGSVSTSTLLHEFAHNWDSGRGTGANPYWNEFRSISWDANGNMLANAVRADFPSSYAYGGLGGTPYEDWADTVTNVLRDYMPSGASAKYQQKVAVVDKFLAMLRQDTGVSDPTSIVVTTTADVVDPNDGMISLREAIANAKPGDTITFAPTLNGRTIYIDASGNFNGGGININKDITIDATGQNISITGNLSYDYTTSYRWKSVFDNYANLTFVGLTFTGLDTHYCYSYFLENNGASNLSLINCRIVGNSCYALISADGNVTLTNTLIAGNSDAFDNYATSSRYGNFGIYGDGQVTINNSTVLAKVDMYYGGSVTLNNSIAELTTQSSGANVTAASSIVIASSGINVTADSQSTVLNDLYGTQGLVKFVHYTNWIDASYYWTPDLWKSWDFHLEADSPAINAGNNTLIPNGITTDLDGNARIIDSAVDMGAYEALLPPTAPAAFVSTALTSNSVTLSWSAQSGLAGYILEYKKTTETNWTEWQPAPGNTATIARITGLTANTEYDFKLTAENAKGTAFSLTSATTLEVGALLPPENLRSTSTAQTTIALQWNSVDGATEYILQLKNSNGDFVQIYKGAAAAFIHQGLTAGTVYEYRVQAVGSVFSSPITVTTAPAGGVDSPMILSTVNNNGVVTITWTDLGPDYVYTVFKAGRIVVNFGNENSYTDANPPTAGVEGYAIMAYNTALRQYANLVTTVAWTTAPPLAITGHEELPGGGIKLLWNAEPGMLYSVFRAGMNVSGTNYITTGEWTDANPQSSNDYMLVAVYHDGTTYRPTFSNLYTVKQSASSQTAASSLDAFWNDYSVNGIDDELFLLNPASQPIQATSATLLSGVTLNVTTANFAALNAQYALACPKLDGQCFSHHTDVKRRHCHVEKITNEKELSTGVS